MSFEVRIAHQAAAYFYRLMDRRTQRAVVRKLSEIGQDPRGSWMKPVSNVEGRFTTLIGSWRLVLVIDHDTRRVDVSVLRPRVGLVGPT